MILVQPPFRLFTCCVTAVCITEMHSILSISLNSAHNSDSFTSMFLKLKVDIETSIGEIFHLLGNICSAQRAYVDDQAEMRWDIKN